MDFIEEWKENERKLREQDAKAKAEGKLVGRFIQEPVADGYALYEIIRENKNTVRIRLIKGIGDDYQISYWGEEATIKKDFALANLGWRDNISKIFSK